MIDWQYYPKSDDPPAIARAVVSAFDVSHAATDSAEHKKSSNEVLAAVAPGLVSLGFRVELGKATSAKIHVPVLFGRNGRPEKSFEADALHEEAGFVLEVEAGRAVSNNQFLKDLFQACMMHDVMYLGIAVRKLYEGGGAASRDFERVVGFFDTLYASRRLTLPLKGILVLGY